MDIRLDLTWMLVGLFLTLRLAVLTAMLPLLSGRSVPATWRIGLAMTLAAATAPAVAAELPPGAIDPSWTSLAAEALRSLGIGFLIGFSVGVPFAAVRFAGTVIGVQIGFGMVNTIDPQTGGQFSALANLYYLLAVLIFFAMDGLHTLTVAMVESTRLLPLFSPIDMGAGAWVTLERFGEFFAIGLRVAAPVILVLLLMSVAMGFVVKTVPQINILVVGFPIKIAAGLAALGVSLTFYHQVFGSVVARMESELAQLLGAMQG